MSNDVKAMMKTRDQQIVEIARARVDRALAEALDVEVLADLADELVEDAQLLSAQGREGAADGMMDVVDALIATMETDLAEDDAEDRRLYAESSSRLGATMIVDAPFVDAAPPQETVVLRSMLVGRRPQRA